MYGQRKFLFFYFSCGFGAVGLTFLVYNFQIYPIVNSLGSEGLSYNLIRDITNLNIIDGQNYSGELLYDRMFSVLESYGKTYSFIYSNSFKLLFDLKAATRPINIDDQ